MELQFQESTVRAWQDLNRLTKTIPLAAESVVPDTRDDIGRILSVWPELYLKGKELRNRSAVIEGEAQLTVLYINESESAVSSFSLTQSFSQEYELPGTDDSDALQLRFSVAGLQARVLNPRKITVDLEIKAELIVSRVNDVVVAQELPETVSTPIHLQYTETELALTTGICEKSFSVNEQLSFPESADHPVEVIGKQMQYEIRGWECVGSRLLVKGEAQMTVFFFARDSKLPCSQQFSVPFSQLIDLGDEQTDAAELWIEATSDYISLTDSIDGGKQLDIELHALAQVRTGRKQNLRLISDAYSNQMPCECRFYEQSVRKESIEQSFLLGCEERIDLPEEFDQLLSFYPTLGPCTAEQGSASVELLCRSNDGNLFAMRRNLSLTSGERNDELSNLSARIEDCQVNTDGKQLVVQMRVNAVGQKLEPVVIKRADTLFLNEEQCFDCSAYPSLTAVWAETESIWELAKCYHSSPEAIKSMNQELSGLPLFIPKTK